MRVLPIWKKYLLQSMAWTTPGWDHSVLKWRVSPLKRLNRSQCPFCFIPHQPVLWHCFWPAVNGYKMVYLPGKQPRFMNTVVGKWNGFVPVLGGGYSPPASLLKCSDSVKYFQCDFALVLPDWQVWHNHSGTKCSNLTTVYSSEDPTVLINNLYSAIIWVSHLPGILPWPIFLLLTVLSNFPNSNKSEQI